MDGDIFGRVTRLGRDAADAVSRALAGSSWDAFHASRCLDALLTAAGGIPSLAVVVVELAGLRGAPLLARIADLASVSMSCDEGEGHKPDPMSHCGLCTSCLFRRIALRAGGLVPDSTTYRDVATRQHGIYELNAFEHHASRLRACRAFDDLVDLDPDARFATTLPLSEPLVNGTPGEAVFAMYQRYAVEIQAYFDAARPKVINLPRQPRKERERDLFSAVG